MELSDREFRDWIDAQGRCRCNQYLLFRRWYLAVHCRNCIARHRFKS
jgi:hypothetical protein